MLKLIRNELQRLVNNIDSGNSNITEQEANDLLEILTKIGEEKLSKTQASKLINCSLPTFDRLVKENKLPKGKKQIGFKELYWLKSDILKYVDNKI